MLYWDRNHRINQKIGRSVNWWIMKSYLLCKMSKALCRMLRPQVVHKEFRFQASHSQFVHFDIFTIKFHSAHLKNSIYIYQLTLHEERVPSPNFFPSLNTTCPFYKIYICQAVVPSLIEIYTCIVFRKKS